MRSLVSRAGVVLLLIFAACDQNVGSRIVVTDSAGVRVVTVDADAGQVLTVDTVPELVIGGGADFHAVEFYRIGSIAVDGDSALFVADGDAQQIVYLNLATRSVARFGGAGDGPLEFRGLGRLMVSPNGNVLAVDNRQRRVIEVTRSGDLVREMTFPDVGSTGGTLVVVPAGPANFEQLYVAVLPGFSNSNGQPFRGTGVIVRLLEPTDTLTTFPGNELFAGRGATGGVLFGAATLFAAGEDGIWLGDTADQSLELWKEGGLATIVRWTTGQPRELTAGRISEFWSRVEQSLPVEQRAALPEMKKLLPFAQVIPAFSGFVVSGQALWIRAYQGPEYGLFDLPAPPEEYLVIDHSAGRTVRAVMPTGFALRSINGTSLIGVHRNEVGLETVRRYRLITTH